MAGFSVRAMLLLVKAMPFSALPPLEAIVSRSFLKYSAQLNQPALSLTDAENPPETRLRQSLVSQSARLSCVVWHGVFVVQRSASVLPTGGCSVEFALHNWDIYRETEPIHAYKGEVPRVYHPS